MVFGMKTQGMVLFCVEQTESEAVKIAAGNLEMDLGRVLGEVRILWSGNRKEEMERQMDWVGDTAVIWIGTIGVSESIRKLVDTDALKDEEGNLRRHRHCITGFSPKAAAISYGC